MPSSSSEARSRVALLALVTLPLWACATAVDDAPSDSSPLAASGSNGDPSAGGRSNGGSGASASGASAGKSGAAGGATGAAGTGASGAAAQNGGAPGNSGGTPGKGGASSGGTGGSGASSAGGSAGKGAGGASAGGSAGKGAGGASAGGASAGGTTSGASCDAAHAVATLTPSAVYTGKANDCVRLSVNPTWSTIALQFQPMPGTAGYPVPFSFFSCGGNGTGSLTADYANTTFESGPNPGCDFFVQFGGGGTTIKVTYYD
ncbi:MAG: hypothetical protein WDO69_14100 [Pseudomonadota bacterium]